MPSIQPRKIGIALDMHGCPNRCRHCYLGRACDIKMSDDDLQYAAARFRSYARPGEERPFIEELTVSSWFREPDFSPNYRRLYQLESELSDGEPARFELLSTWRLARDERYAEWAKQVGPDTCQITFFGVGETQDWFYRRRGAFQDCLRATERLLVAGMKPRWQLFLTRKILPELGSLLRIVERLRIREKVDALGGEFQIFVHTPGPDGEARKIEYLRPRIEETKGIPLELIEASQEHLKREKLWYTERELVSEILKAEDRFPSAYPYDKLWFLIESNWDVFSNLGPLEPWWRLGNLKRDRVGTIVESFENDQPLGLRTIQTVPAKTLARRFGDPEGLLIYSSADDLLSLFVAEHCEANYKGDKTGAL